MIATYFFLAIIFIGFYIFKKSKKNNQSNLSECSICNEVFDEIYITEIDDLPLCREHAKSYVDFDWSEFTSVDCTPDKQQASIDLYESKLDDYKKGILGFIKSSYKEIDGEIVTTLVYYTKK